jgi:ABC-type amino acid transport substrate-binding protein
MKKIYLSLFLLFTIPTVVFSQDVKLNVLNYNNYPFSFTDNDGNYKGIEVDILNEFVLWAAKNKGINFITTYKTFGDFNKFVEGIKQDENPNNIGLGSLSITDERKKHLLFTAPYLKNVSVLITSGNLETIKSIEDATFYFQSVKAVTIKGSVHEKYLTKLKASYIPSLEIKYVESPKEVMKMLMDNPNMIAYADIISYWSFLNGNKNSQADKTAKNFLKMQRAANIENEYFAFALPKNSELKLLLNEFFESGFGFTSTKKYHEILENYLGYEVMDAVEIY